jgi:hypothetical protein
VGWVPHLLPLVLQRDSPTMTVIPKGQRDPPISDAFAPQFPLTALEAELERELNLPGVSGHDKDVAEVSRIR